MLATTIFSQWTRDLGTGPLLLGFGVIALLVIGFMGGGKGSGSNSGSSGGGKGHMPHLGGGGGSKPHGSGNSTPPKPPTPPTPPTPPPANPV